METHARSIVKAITWRIVATIIALGVAYDVTNAIGRSLEIASAVAVVSTTAYYIHERIWNRVLWGRKGW